MMADDRLTFPKSERLRHKILVDTLFRKGGTIFEYPLKLQYRALTAQELKESFRVGVPDRIAPLQVMITIPKKKRRHAVDRVLMRRRIREAYRLNRRSLRRQIEEHPGIRTLSLALIYISEDNIDYPRIERKVQKLLSRLATQFPIPDSHPEKNPETNP
ncbi:MAG: ribonuclease P protein component, partial [Muribaculaceae bacterium]|nr:ribonuclease P protein component [Muribaculaceae bacterium]